MLSAFLRNILTWRRKIRKEEQEARIGKSDDKTEDNEKAEKEDEEETEVCFPLPIFLSILFSMMR